MKELTLKQKNDFIDYQLKEYANSQYDLYLCNAFHFWYEVSINDDVEGGVELKTFPELLNTIKYHVKKLGGTISVTKHYIESCPMYCTKMQNYDGVAYRVNLLKVLKKRINKEVKQ